MVAISAARTGSISEKKSSSDFILKFWIKYSHSIVSSAADNLEFYHFIRISNLFLQPNLKFTKHMATNRTFTMLKPDAIENGHTGKIIDMIIQAGFEIKVMKLTRLTEAQAKEFYAVHAERPFYGELVEYMTSGPIVAAILEKENAVADFRALIGSTDPADAAEGTIRKYYAESKGRNAVHGSDSDENAEIEGKFHFKAEELI